MKIGDLFMGLLIEGGGAEFKKSVEKAAGDAGTAGAKKLSSTMALGLKVGSVIVGGAFALMTKGALQMEEAQGKFQAATGRSRDEAIKFSQDMNGLVGTAKTVGQSFDEITATGIAVSQQFDITGQKATDLTEDILGFAKVTGQDASDAAGALDGVLTSFGLSADDAAGFMDKLVFSTQKYGTDSGPATLATLQKMAPALTTMGMSLDDGVELLNAFETAEIDADTAQRGLQKAIAELKPGETLDDLITQIGAIEDPTLRAQKAIEIFGTKAGVGLAKIIQPGMTSLDEFGVTADEAAGTVDTAAENLLTTSDKFKMFAEKIGGFLREGGQAFGPLLTGLASLGTLAAPMAKLGINMAKGLTGVFTGLLRNVGLLGAATAVGVATGEAEAAGHVGAATGPKFLAALGTKFAAIQGSLNALGDKAGGLMGKAMGIALVLGVAVAAEEASNNDDLRNGAQAAARNFFAMFGDEAEGLLHGTVLDSATDGFHSLWNALAQISIPLGDDAGTWTGDAYGSGVGKAIQDHRPLVAGEVDGFVHYLADHSAELFGATGETLGGTLVEGTAHGIVHSSGTVSQAYRDMLDVGFVDAYRESQAAATELGAGLPGSVGDAIYDHATEAISGIEHLRDVLENGLTPRQIALEAMGAKYIKDVRKGMESEIPGARQTAQQVAGEAIEAIEEAGLNGTKGQKGFKRQGEYYIELLNSGMTSMEARAFLAAQGVSDETIDGLESRYPQFTAAGTGAMDKVIGAINKYDFGPSGAGSAGEWISAFVNKISHKDWFIGNKDPFENNSPPDILPNIDKQGFATGRLWAENLTKGAAMGLDVLKANFSMPSFTGTATMELHHTVDIRGDAGVLDERKLADYLNEGAAGFAWNLEHAMSAVNSG